MIRVVVTGSECTGKTTLARALAAHYATTWVPEYARQFVAEKRAAPVYDDVETIARGQIEIEDSTRPGDTVSILDTDLISTAIYSRHYYADCPAWVEQAASERAADLYLLAGIDVPWAADDEQRDRGDRREEMQQLFRRALTERGLEFVDIEGSEQERLSASISAIDLRLQASD